VELRGCRRDEHASVSAIVAERCRGASFVRMPGGSVGDRRLALSPVESRAWRQFFM
jgi:hypothetical protein